MGSRVIIVDENIRGTLIIDSITQWYPGQVIPITNLRRETLVHDDGIATLLHQVSNPTFVTINVSDFWLKLRPNKNYCIIGIVLVGEQADLLPDILRDLLRLPEFRTKAARMGKIIRVRPSRIEYYGLNRQIDWLPWPA